MSTRHATLVAGIAAVALVVASVLVVSRGHPAGPRLVVLYAPCTVNRSFLAPYNAAAIYTPHLAAFAREGLVFTKHHTETGLSGVAYAALLSGNQAMRHGVYQHPKPLDEGQYLIGEAFRDAGYEAFYWADQPMASPELNYGQGVAPENTFWDGQGEGILRGDDPRFRRVLGALRDDPHSRAFLLTTFSVTHIPYETQHVGEFCQRFPSKCAGLSEEEIARFATLFREHGIRWQHAFDDTVGELGMSAEEVSKLIRVVELLYKSNVYHLDQLFGGVVAAIDEFGLHDQTLIAFTADHGELMYRANAPYHWTHGHALAPETLVVPLIVRGPGVASGSYDAVTRSIDVFPTLAGLAGVSPPIDTMGTDLSPAVRGEQPAPPQIAFSHSALLPGVPPAQWLPVLARRFPRNRPREMWVAARRGDLVYKVVSEDGETFSLRVYDWESDPGETEDLYDPEDETQLAMARALGEYKQALREAFKVHEAATPGHIPNARQLEQLRQLGYIQ